VGRPGRKPAPTGSTPPLLLHSGRIWEPMDTYELLWAMAAPLPPYFPPSSTPAATGNSTSPGNASAAGAGGGIGGRRQQEQRQQQAQGPGPAEARRVVRLPAAGRGADGQAGLQPAGGPGSGPAAGSQQPRLMVDVGANVGWFTAVAGARGYDVYAFEGGPSARPRAPPMLPATRHTACLREWALLAPLPARTPPPARATSCSKTPKPKKQKN
jgi:hypothetical protein